MITQSTNKKNFHQYPFYMNEWMNGSISAGLKRADLVWLTSTKCPWTGNRLPASSTGAARVLNSIQKAVFKAESLSSDNRKIHTSQRHFRIKLCRTFTMQIRVGNIYMLKIFSLEATLSSLSEVLNQDLKYDFNWESKLECFCTKTKRMLAWEETSINCHKEVKHIILIFFTRTRSG